MADVALVPEGHVLHRGEGVPPYQPGQPADALGQLRIALVGHRGGARLVGAERLLGLPQLGTLQGPDLGGEFLQGADDQRQGGDKLGMPVPLHDLVGDGSRREAQPGAGLGLQLWGYGGIGADRPGNLAHGYLPPRLMKPVAVTVGLLDPHRHLQPEGRGLGVYSVGTSGHRRMLVLHRLVRQRRYQFLKVLVDQAGGLAQLQAECGVYDVR